MSANFTLYRRGLSILNLKSRQQGEIRKMSTATFHQEIMTDDSIKISLVSIKRIDFRLRDYIIYEDRPYFLNRLPQSSIDESGRYVYQMTFEGGMFELGRKVFMLHDAIGYDFYGNLAEFGRLIVRNMNDNNMFIEWDLDDPHGEPRHLKAKFYGTARDSHDTTTLYMWGTGFNHDLDGMGERFIYTNGLPVIDDEHEVHPVDPEDLSIITDCVITAVHQWTLDFPKNQSTPAEYPSVPIPIPQTVYVIDWDTENPTIGDTFWNLWEYLYDNSRQEGSEEWVDFAQVVEKSEVELPDPLIIDPIKPTAIGDIATIEVPIYFKVHYYKSYEYQSGEPVVYWDKYEIIEKKVTVTFRSIQNIQGDWQIEPVSPPSGEVTSDDYPTDELLLTYEDRSCLAVLQDLMENWRDWEFVIETSVNDIGFANGAMRVCGVVKIRQKFAFDASHTLHNLGFGRSGGIHQIVRKYADESNIPSRVYFFGGSNNLPQYYRNTRLCLPKREREDSYIDFAQFVNTDFSIGISNAPCEEVKIIDGIYPASNPFVLDETCSIAMEEPTQISTDKHSYLHLMIPLAKLFKIDDVWEPYIFPDYTIVDFSDYPDYEEWLSIQGYGKEDTEDRRKRYEKYYSGEVGGTMKVTKYLQNATPATFTFQTGDLAGYQLTMHKYEESEENGVMYCNIWLNVVNEQNVEQNGYHVPNSTVICHQGDKFIIDGINMPPQYTYYQDGSEDDYSAENALWKAAVDYMNEVAEKVDYEISVARDFVKRNNVKFNVFDCIQFNDMLSEYAPTLKKRIVSVELDLIDGYTYKLNITNRKMIRPTSVLRGILGIRKEK